MSGSRLSIALVVPGGVDPSGRRYVIPSLLWFIERLARRHDVHVFVLRYFERPCDYALLGAIVHDIGRPHGRPGWRAARQWRRLAAAVRRHGPFDVIHGLWVMPAGVMAVSLARVLGIASVVTCDSGEFAAIPDIAYGSQLSWRGRLGVGLATRAASAVHVCSAFMADAARARGLAPVEIPFGIDLALFRPMTHETSASVAEAVRARQRTGASPRLLHVASINQVKGLSTLLCALSRLRREHDTLSLDVVGEDTLGGRLVAECASLGLDACVRFHGFRESRDLAAFYRRADLLMLPSRHEAAGVVVLEAAAAGLPTVGSALGYVSDWSPAAARAVPPNDPDALAAATSVLLRDADARAALAAAAFERASSYDVDRTVERFEHLYYRIAVR